MILYKKELITDLKSHSFAYLNLSQEKYVLNITLNRPQKKNALTPLMIQELVYVLSYARYSNEVRVIVIDAEGDMFCAGADLKAFAGDIIDEPYSSIPEFKGELLLGEAFLKSYKPCIAKVEGNVYAGAFLIICGCQYVISTQNAVFGLPEVRRGIWPMQVMHMMLNMMPARQVLDMCMRGKVISSEEALNLGLVTHLTSKSEINQTLDTLKREIGNQSPTAIRYGLEAFDQLKNIAEGEKQKYLKSMLYNLLKSDDAKEGILAFKEKRDPVWPAS